MSVSVSYSKRHSSTATMLHIATMLFSNHVCYARLVSVTERVCPCSLTNRRCFICLLAPFIGVCRYRRPPSHHTHARTHIHAHKGLSYTSGALNHYVGWRNCLRIWGGPGILLAGLAIFFLKEPARGLSDKPERRAMNSQHPPEAAAPASLGAMLRRAWNTKSYILLCVAASVTMFARFALAAWLAPFYQDHFEQDAVKYGPIIGTCRCL